jgi:hypothetical protein
VATGEDKRTLADNRVSSLGRGARGRWFDLGGGFYFYRGAHFPGRGLEEWLQGNRRVLKTTSKLAPG